MTSSQVSPDPVARRSVDDHLARHLTAWLADSGNDIIGFRRELHANPDLSGAEHASAQRVARRLTQAGLAPTLLPAGNGVICEVGRTGPVIALRADLDALPLPDPKDVPYRSTAAGVCHACGHDVHTAVVLGVGLALAATEQAGAGLPFRLRLLFQPSEEKRPFGSLDVIDAGGLDGVAAIYALHCDPILPAGQVGLRVGALTAACDFVTVRASGPGGHTARPHLTADLVGALGRIVAEVPGLLGRKFDARSAVLTTFGEVHAGTAQNIIPGSGYAAGTVRVLDAATWQTVPEVFVETVRQVAAPTGVEVDVEYSRGVPPVDNDATAVEVLRAAATVTLGPDAVQPTRQGMGGEDFGWYLRHVPGAMVRLGVGRGEADVDIHHPQFDVDERAIGYGVSLLAAAVVRAASMVATGSELATPASGEGS